MKQSRKSVIALTLFANNLARPWIVHPSSWPTSLMSRIKFEACALVVHLSHPKCIIPSEQSEKKCLPDSPPSLCSPQHANATHKSRDGLSGQLSLPLLDWVRYRSNRYSNTLFFDLFSNSLSNMCAPPHLTASVLQLTTVSLSWQPFTSACRSHRVVLRMRCFGRSLWSSQQLLNLSETLHQPLCPTASLALKNTFTCILLHRSLCCVRGPGFP